MCARRANVPAGVPDPSLFSDDGAGGCQQDPCDRRPVERVNWYEAVAFCNERSGAEGLQRCYLDPAGGVYDVGDAVAKALPVWSGGSGCPGYRLPTEAEWEIAARAGTRLATPAGNLDASRLWCEPNPTLEDFAWFCGNSDDRTHPVATKAANPWGLHDLLGSVWEWCWDWLAPYPAGPLLDPAGPDRGTHRVMRGGAWVAGAKHIRFADRSANPPGAPWWGTGLRPVRSVP